jgi:hypothetical protein
MRTDTSRQMLSEGALLELLNWELAAYDECAGCRFTAVQTGRDGYTSCNWSGARLETDHPLGLQENLIARLVVSETKTCYDLAPR